MSRVRSALVTGASRGIGLAIANRLQASGVDVIRPSRVELDLACIDSVKSFLVKMSDREVDILINNAGENIINSIVDISWDDWDRIHTINTDSVFLLSQFFGKKMVSKGKGHILNVSSVYSFLARPGRAAYSSSKGALNSFTRVCAVEWGTKNVIVNSLAPGFVNTELTRKNNSPEVIEKIVQQIPLGRLVEPSEVAELACFLVSEFNTYLTGQNIVADGGFSIQ